MKQLETTQWLQSCILLVNDSGDYSNKTTTLPIAQKLKYIGHVQLILKAANTGMLDSKGTLMVMYISRGSTIKNKK